MSFQDYEEVYIDDNPARFYAMHNPLIPIQNPQTKAEKEAVHTILDTLEKLTPYLGRNIYVGKQGRARYFMKPEAVSGGIQMNCSLVISSADL